ncbi:MAG: Fis family transcriptional regulator [Gracilibacter sp. BRH_c7a]|nr:MAG: Fis family transcriptional regulator [Gracilibacter sp. BRH_c7a]
MVEHYNEAQVKKNRLSFIIKGEFFAENLREEILASWLRCKESNLDPKASMVDLPPNLSKAQSQPNPIMSFLRDDILPDIVGSLYQLLEKCQGALFWVYSDSLVVFSQRGDKKLLQELNSKNIGIGTCLSEQYIGTTGISLSSGPHQESWVIGHEHYLDMFTPYVTYSYCQEDFYGLSYAFIILPQESFTPLFLDYIRLFHQARTNTIICYRNRLESELKDELFSQFFEMKNEAVIFIDSFGKIVDVNQKFTVWFQLELTKVKDRDLVELIPEMERVLTCLETGKRIISEEVQLPELPAHSQFVRMDVIPTIKDQKITGLIVTLMDNKTVRQRVSKISNQAYYTFDEIIGESKSLLAAKLRAVNAANSSSNVIISGESGTGKELFAHSIHNASQRREGPFVSINCAAIPTELIASELFGYVEGAFTGARKGGSMGKFEYANTGTIFLDEIGEMPIHVQTILLRVLEERTVTRIGSNVSTPIDVRLICATNRNLHKMVKDRTFRLDLYFRINVLHIHLPPLRERITDIPIIVDYYLNYFNSFLNKTVKEISPEAMDSLIKNPWEGNLRELRNTIECGVNNAIGDVLELEHLPRDYFEDDDLSITQTDKTAVLTENDFTLEEKRIILNLMIKYNGNKSQVAQDLGMSRSTLYRKLKDYNLA